MFILSSIRHPPDADPISAKSMVIRKHYYWILMQTRVYP